MGLWTLLPLQTHPGSIWWVGRGERTFGEHPQGSWLCGSESTAAKGPSERATLGQDRATSPPQGGVGAGGALPPHPQTAWSSGRSSLRGAGNPGTWFWFCT